MRAAASSCSASWPVARPRADMRAGPPRAARGWMQWLECPHVRRVQNLCSGPVHGPPADVSNRQSEDASPSFPGNRQRPQHSTLVPMAANRCPRCPENTAMNQPRRQSAALRARDPPAPMDQDRATGSPGNGYTPVGTGLERVQFNCSLGVPLTIEKKGASPWCQRALRPDLWRNSYSVFVRLLANW